MMKEFMLGSVLLIAAVIAARADDTGLAAIHDWRREGGRTCLSDHFHDGAGTGDTRKAAEAKAIVSWIEFTVLEYGTDWGSYKIAGSKRMDCTEKGAKEWSCALSARACHAGGLAKPKKAKGKAHSFCTMCTCKAKVPGQCRVPG
jgi:hypothetical protein